MPIFEYLCQRCDHRFEVIVLGSQKAACPKCESKRLTQQLSSFAVGGERSQPGTDTIRPAEAAGIHAVPAPVQ